MKLEEKVERSLTGRIWDNLKINVAKGLFYGAMTLTGCGGGDGVSSDPAVTHTKTDAQGEADITDAGGTNYRIIVKDERDLALLQDADVYTIYHSTELFSKLFGYIADFRIAFTSGDIEIHLSKLSDRLADNLDNYKVKMDYRPMDLSNMDDLELLDTNVPLSQLADYYETHENECGSVGAVLEVATNYWEITTFAAALSLSRNAVINNASRVANLLGLNPDNIRYDIYKQRGTGFLYHERVDGTFVSNVKPTVTIEYVRGAQGGNVPINFKLNDFESNLCDILIEYSTNGGVTFNPVSQGEMNNLSADPDGENHTFFWNSLVDGIAMDSLDEKVLIRMTPNDTADGMSNLVSILVNNPFNVSRNGGDSIAPNFVIDSSGVLHSVWPDNTFVNSRILYSRFNGVWSSPSIISTVIGYSSDIDADPSNNLYVIFRDDNDNLFLNEYTGSWSPSAIIHDGANPLFSPQIVVDSNNKLHVGCEGDFGQTIYHLKRDGSWSSSIVSTFNVGEFSMAADSIGRVHLVRDDSVLPNSTNGIPYYRYVASWSPPIMIPNTDDFSFRAEIAVDSNNNLHAIWKDIGINGIAYSKYTSGWSAPVRVPNGGHVESVIAVDPSNIPYVAWLDTNLPNERIMFSKYTGSWSSPVGVYMASGNLSNLKLAVDSSNLHFMWGDNSLGNYEILHKRVQK